MQHSSSREVTGIISRGIWQIPSLQSFLQGRAVRVGRFGAPAARVDAIAGWGRRPTTERARAYAARRDLPFLALEDGFLRSVGLGVAGAAPSTPRPTERRKPSSRARIGSSRRAALARARSVGGRQPQPAMASTSAEGGSIAE